jgi:SAM-dependent methyltransferase
MDPGLYPRMAEVEDTHWWFAARRAICKRLLDRLDLPPDAAILEAGCGTGGNFPLLARHGRIFAMDADESALSFAASRKLADLARGSLPDKIPFVGTNFDLAIMTDVLEHLDDPAGSLRAIHARLKPRGWLLLTVPATPWLWGDHDLTHHHRRRYQTAELRTSLTAAGFEVTYLSYYNFILFLPIATARMIGRLVRRTREMTNGYHDLAMPSPLVNRILFQLFSAERSIVGRIRIPVGVSLIALARA